MTPSNFEILGIEKWYKYVAHTRTRISSSSSSSSPHHHLQHQHHRQHNNNVSYYIFVNVLNAIRPNTLRKLEQGWKSQWKESCSCKSRIIIQIFTCNIRHASLRGKFGYHAPPPLFFYLVKFRSWLTASYMFNLYLLLIWFPMDSVQSMLTPDLADLAVG